MDMTISDCLKDIDPRKQGCYNAQKENLPGGATVARLALDQLILVRIEAGQHK